MWKLLCVVVALFSAGRATTQRAPYEPFSGQQLDAVTGSNEPHEFQAEVSRLMDIIINSLYAQKDVFVRELISNAGDALEKIRFLSIADPEVLGSTRDLGIYIEADKESGTVIISDTGIGMTKQDLINNLGTVAKSGTTNFLEALAGGSDVNLIGQFGVGFYSAFLVADKVTVISKHNDDSQHIWTSRADPYFAVAADPRGNTLGRGTQIVLHLKEDSLEFLEPALLQSLAQRYSQYTPFEIFLRMEEEVPDEDALVDDGEEQPTKSVERWVLVNEQKALWLRSKDEVTEEEYNEFYLTLAHDPKPPLAHVHLHAEGEIQFKALIYLPQKPGSEYMERVTNIRGPEQHVKLYARRVLVADSHKDLLPAWMSFLRGVIDSNDLPLKVDREALTQHKVLAVIGKRLARKVLELLRKLSQESLETHETYERELEDNPPEEGDEERKPPVTTFDKFWKEFKDPVRLGCLDDDANRQKIAKILRFASNKRDEITLDQYIDEMQESQKGIYYISGFSKNQLMNSPHMQIFNKKDIEVLFLTGNLDEPCLHRMLQYENKPLISIEKGDIAIDKTQDEQKLNTALTLMYMPLTKFMKEALGKRVHDVQVSSRLVDDPMAVVAPEWGYSAHGERLMKAQGIADEMHLNIFTSMKTLEINHAHPLIKHLLLLVQKDPKSEFASGLTNVLFDGALIASGFEAPDPARIASALYRGAAIEMGIDPNEGTAAPEIPESYFFGDDDVATEPNTDWDDVDLDMGEEIPVFKESAPVQEEEVPVTHEVPVEAVHEPPPAIPEEVEAVHEAPPAIPEEVEDAQRDEL